MTTTATTTELITTEGLVPATVFNGEGLDPLLSQIEARARSLVPDLTTAKGRKAVASMANKVARSKTLLDGMGKDLVAGRKAEIKKVDEERKRCRERLDALKTEVRQPLTDWEDAEKQRIEQLAERLQGLRNFADPSLLSDATAETLQAKLDEVNAIEINDSWQEKETEAGVAKEAAVKQLEEKLAARTQYEADQVELARLRAEREEQERKEREERLAREAKEKAEAEAAAAKEKAEREAQERVETERRAKEDAERRVVEAEERRQREAAEAKAEAEREAKAAEERAKQQAEAAAQAERDRIERERRQAEADQMARAKDREHRGSINRQALDSLMTSASLSEDQAKAVVTAIANNQIANVTINY